jgi:hypothetical protein
MEVAMGHAHKLNSPVAHKSNKGEKWIEIMWIIAGIILLFLACGLLTVWQI